MEEKTVCKAMMVMDGKYRGDNTVTDGGDTVTVGGDDTVGGNVTELLLI